MDKVTENINNSYLYKYSESGIKLRDINLWKKINEIQYDISFKEKFYLYEMKMDMVPSCYCGADLKFIDMVSGYRNFCSKKCLANSIDTKRKRKETCIERYGVDNPSKLEDIKAMVRVSNNIKYGVDYPLQSNDMILKSKQSFIDKYGVDNPSKLPEIREKAKKTIKEKYGVDHIMLNNDILNKNKTYFIDKYGVDNPSKLPEVREKAKKTTKEKYGVENALESNIFLDKMKSTNLKKYGKEFYTKTSEYKDRIDQIIFNKNSNIINNEFYELILTRSDEYTILCKKCSNVFKIQRQLWRNRTSNSLDICLNCNPIKNGVSISENKIYEIIKENYKGEIIKNYKGLKKEVDIYLPELKIGFEFNGLYWHSELFKNKGYHNDKYSFFDKNGIKMFSIWEDDWLYKQDIVKSMIINKLCKTPNKIYARKCEIREVEDNKLVRKFLEENHIQGFIGSKIKLGLYFNNELVSLMTFGNLRKSLGQKSQEGFYELLRFCNKLNTNVVGGASKLFKYFLNNYDVENVISFSLNSYSSGDIYSKLGFSFIKETKYNYFWVKNSIRYHRFGFRKDKLVKDGFDSNKTEIQIMYDRGYYRIFDCGSKKWVLEHGGGI